MVDVPRVLIADGHELMRERLNLLLGREESVEVVGAVSDGLAAIALAAEKRPDVVILDVMMPYMDGFEVLKTLRRDPGLQNIPVVMLTAKAQDKDVFEGYHYGADVYLTKPFNPMELVTFVKRILQSGSDDGGDKRYDI